MEAHMKPIRTAARAMLGSIFVGTGVLALRNADRLVPQAKPVTDFITPALEAADLPTEPLTLIKANAALQVAGGLMLATGRFPRPAAAALAVSLVPTTIARHPFWTEQDPQRRTEQRIHFAKNMGLLGGLLLAAADTGGRPSLMWRAGYAARRTGGVARQAQKSVRRAAHTTERSVRRAANTTRREARLAVRAASLGRRLPR
jgi:putative oxidoreductase